MLRSSLRSLLPGRLRTLLAAAIFAAGAGWVASPSARCEDAVSPEQREAADRARTKVVVLKTVRPTGKGAGTGFLAAPRLVVTAGHVVADATQVTAWVNGVAYPAVVVGRHPDVDLAALRLRAPELLLKPAELAGSAELADAEPLLVLAGPSQGPEANGDPAVRALLPARFERRLAMRAAGGKTAPMLEMRGSVRKGDSGSPVLRVRDGKVVGVLSSRALPDAAGVSHLAYAVPIELLHPWLQSLPAAPPASPAMNDDDFYLKR